MKDIKRVKNPAHYALRRTLPEWRFDENLAELLEKVKLYKIDEVIVKVDTEEFSHGHLLVDWVKNYQQKLFRIKAELEKLGVIYSLNPWITVGHCDRGRDDSKRLPELITVVGHDGATCKHCACHLSQTWRDNLTKIWSLYAETKPHIMWVEDDIRSFNHEPARFGCFCELHMERFCTRIGKKVSREELVSAILQAGEVHPYRVEYLEMQQEIINDTAKFIGQLIHRVSPLTSIGLMSSGPRQHVVENRNWHTFAQNIADNRPLYSRPPMWNYNEGSLRGFYYSHDSIKLTRHVLPAGTIEQTEVESVPFSRFSKSVNFTFLEIALSFAYGSHAVTMNLFDHLGTPLGTEEHYGMMLEKSKPYLNSLAYATQEAGKFRGVQILHHSKSSLSKKLVQNADYSALMEDGFEMMNALEAHGISTTFEDEKVVAISGQTIRAYSDEEILKFLRNGVFLDAEAAQILCERGFGRYLGIKNFRKLASRQSYPFIISAEAYENEKFGGAKRKYLTTTLPFLDATCKFADMELDLDKVEVISNFIDQDTNNVLIGMFAFENELGGRVVVHALDYTSAVGVAYFHPFRREELQNVINYLSFGHSALLFDCDGAFSLAWRKDCQNYTILGAFNFNLDDWKSCEFNLDWQYQLPSVTMLLPSGDWILCDEFSHVKVSKNNGGSIKVRIKEDISFRHPLVLKLAF